MGAGETPLGPRRFDFGALSDDDFELLCFLVVLLEFGEAVRLRAPDRGTDSALPGGEGRGYRRCWQAKRFTGTMGWAKCKASLDAAVSAYGMPHYTFCFARDLTGNQERVFRRDLVGRHAGVRVDYWGASRITARLLGSPEGERIANHFYPDPSLNTRAFMEALRAGGPLETGADASQRLAAVADWLASHDPFFSYTTSTREAHVPPPEPHAGVIAAVEETRGRTVTRFEAIPRNPEAVREFGPTGKVMFEDTPEGRSALDAFRRVFLTGEQVTVDKGVSVEFDRMPPLFAQLYPAEIGPAAVTLGPARNPPRPKPWPARLRARSDVGEADLDLDLEPVDPPADWHGALEGAFGGLTATVLIRAAEDHGEAVFKFRYVRDPSLAIADQLAATSILLALHGKGTCELRDRDGGPRRLDFDLPGLPPPRHLEPLRDLLANVRLIEEWSGRTLSLPESISGDEVHDIAELGYILRNGQSRMKFDQLTVDVDEEGYNAFREGTAGPLRVTGTVRPVVFGVEIFLGFLAGEIPDYAITEATPTADGLISVTLEPTTDEARTPVFAFHRERPSPGGAPTS